MKDIFTLLLTALGLLFATNLAVRNTTVNKYSKRYFLIAVAIDIIILINEALAILTFWGDNFVLQNITSGLSFILAPFLPYFIIMMNLKEMKFTQKIMLIPALLNVLLVITTPHTHLLFYITENGLYIRGSLFWISWVLCAFYFSFVVTTSFQKYREADYYDKLFLAAILIMVVIGVALQVISPEIMSMWPTVAVALQIYYIFELEMTHKYDALTGAWNRNAYTDRVNSLNALSDYSVVVCDLNNLKMVNDIYGHEAGDKYIMHSATILKESFYGIGSVYRIGGDEFCIIAEGNVFSKLDARLNKMHAFLENANKNHYIPVTMSIAYGFEHHLPGSATTYDKIFEAADQKMYDLKKKQHDALIDA